MTDLSYKEAFEELQQIVADLEKGEILVDELSEKVSRASVLIRICKAKLTTTEEDVQKILAAIERPVADEDETPQSTGDPSPDDSLPF